MHSILRWFCYFLKTPKSQVRATSPLQVLEGSFRRPLPIETFYFRLKCHLNLNAAYSQRTALAVNWLPKWLVLQWQLPMNGISFSCQRLSLVSIMSFTESITGPSLIKTGDKVMHGPISVSIVYTKFKNRIYGLSIISVYAFAPA